MNHRIFILWVAACGDQAPPSPPAPDPVRDIRGTATLATYDDLGDRTAFPIGLHDTLIAAHFPVGDGWDVREGTTRADGTFSIAAAPHGSYWLDVYDIPTGRRQLLWTDATVLEFEEDALGRGDAAAAGPGTTLTFSVDGLDPLQVDDGLDLASGNLGLSGNLFTNLVADATTLEATRPWSGLPLLSAGAHDRLILTQLRSSVDPVSGIAYRAPIKSATFDTIEQRDRQDTPVAATAVTPPALDYELVWQRSQFAAAAGAIHPSRVGAVAGENFLFRAMPGGTKFGTSPLAPLVLDIDPGFFGTDTTDVDEKFSIPNPYPASWLFNELAMVFPVTIPVPGVADGAIEIGASIEVDTNELASPAHPIVPLVTPPRTPTIDGADLFVDHTGVGVVPDLAWTPPAVGTPTAYVVFVEHWEQQPGFSDLGTIATLVIPGDVTHVRMPARLLVAGERYLLRIAAIYQHSQDVRVHSLYSSSVPSGFAELVTNTFAVTPADVN